MFRSFQLNQKNFTIKKTHFIERLTRKVFQLDNNKLNFNIIENFLEIKESEGTGKKFGILYWRSNAKLRSGPLERKFAFYLILAHKTRR